MDENTTPKVSFSLSPAPSSRPNHSAAQIPSQSLHQRAVAAAASISPRADPGDEAADGTVEPQFITFFDVSLTLTASEGANPIPPIPNAKMNKVFRVPEDIEDYDRWKFWEDMKELPEHRGMEEYERVKVEDFAVAYLAGYGWSKGQVIGFNKMLRDPETVEYTRTDGTAGLGYRKPEEGNLNPAKVAAQK